MHQQGLVLATDPEACCVEPSAAGPQFARPLFTIESVSYEADVVVTRLASGKEVTPPVRALGLAAGAAR